jgi:hypothetical protein
MTISRRSEISIRPQLNAALGNMSSAIAPESSERNSGSGIVPPHWSLRGWRNSGGLRNLITN